MHREVAAVIAHDLRDPRIPEIVTITRIHLGTDLRNATIFVSIFEEEEVVTPALDALNKAAPFIQRIVASKITIKHFPRILFKLDNTFVQTQHIHELLKEVNDDLG